MSLDTLIAKDLVNFRKAVIASFKDAHPQIFSIVERVLKGHQNMVGMQVTENGVMAGTFTFVLDGIDITAVKSGELESAVHHSLFGVIKPYITIERSAIETMIRDEQFKKDLFSAFVKYLPDLTFKFLR